MTEDQGKTGGAWTRRGADLAVRAALALVFGIAAAGYLRGAWDGFAAVDWQHPQPREIGHALSVLAVCLYTTMIAGLYVVRLPPVSRFAGVWPCVAALLGGFMMAGLLWLEPRRDLPLMAQLASCGLMVAGNVFVVVALSQLGRSFSILPESRRLVTRGVYAVVRHPVYLAEAIATLGTLITFLSLEAVAIVAVQMMFQFLRMHYEEKVLRENFPEYATYAQRTARFIPFVY